jgi:uncharacterized lipoprotein YddW (UPF0748 family)
MVKLGCNKLLYGCFFKKKAQITSEIRNSIHRLAGFLNNTACFCAIFLCVLLACHHTAAAEKPRKGLWIEAEGTVRPLSDPGEFNNLIKTLHKYSFTDVYVQIYRNGKSWFPSRISDTTPYENNKKTGFDPVAALIRYCTAHNIKVHAWMNVLRMGDESVPFIQKNGASVVLHDRSGRSLLETGGNGIPGCRPDTPGVWLDPASREVRRNTLMVIREITKLYPELSGIHFDYLRYPFPLAGEGSEKKTYCSSFVSYQDVKSRGSQRARMSTGFSSGKKEEDDHSITGLLQIARRYIEKRAPHLEVSAAVLSNVERAKKHGKQDWPLWLRMGLLDTVVTMNYTTDSERFLRESRQSSKVAGGRVLIGLGAWLSLSRPEILYRDLKNIRDLNTQGVVLFSYANLANSGGQVLFRHLDAYPFR